jgi:hypothetical protein
MVAAVTTCDSYEDDAHSKQDDAIILEHRAGLSLATR